MENLVEVSPAAADRAGRAVAPSRCRAGTVGAVSAPVTGRGSLRTAREREKV